MQAYESTAIPELNAVQTPWAQVILAWIRNQTGAELFGMPGYRLTLKGGLPEGFITAPHDVRPVNTHLGKAILAGRFTLAGARMSVQGSGDPWNRPSPSRAFAVELHRFNWLPALMSQGDDGAKEAGRLFSLWHKTFCRWTPFSWSEEILPRRLINVAIFAKRLVQVSPQHTGEIAQCLSEQGRHLSRLNNNPAWQGDKAVALIILGCVLSGKAGYNFLKQGQKLLPKALKRLVLNDGSHVSRSPQQGLNLLYDLLLIEDAMNQRGLATPETLDSHVDQLSRFVRALSHPDGSLCAFQGAESLQPEDVLPALVRNDARPAATETPAQLDDGRFHRLAGRSLVVVADAGEPRADAYGYAACDHPMAFEVSGGRDKLMVLPGWSPKQTDRQGFRIVPAGNTLTLADTGILTPITGRFGELLNFGLQGARYKVRSRRVEAEDAGSLLEMEHDGWKAKFGLRHERRLYIDAQRDELRGEDRLTPLEAKQDVPMAAPFAIHFLLHPEVQASMARDKKSVLLRGPGGRGWWLRHDAKDVVIEDSHVFEHDVLRKTLLVTLKGVGRLDAPTRVRWKLSPAEA